MNRIVLPLLAVLALLAGCTAPRAVVFVTGTQLGIEVNTVEGGQQSAHVGYRRAEGVAMPLVAKYDEVVDKRGKPTTNHVQVVMTNAYPVISLFQLDTGSLLVPATTQTATGSSGPLRLHQVFATGRAAVIAVQSGAAKQDFATLSQRVASDDSSKALQKWLDPDATHAARRDEIKAWLATQGPAVAAIKPSMFVWDAPHESLRREFLKFKADKGEPIP